MVAHIDSYQSAHSYEYVDNFKVFIIHAGGACDYEDTQNTIYDHIGKRADLNIYIKNTNLNISHSPSESQLEQKCNIVILNNHS
jgi:hypothetical protein